MQDKIAITLGNPNGIGPEVCAKALKQLKSELLKRIILIGDEATIVHYFDKSILNEIELDIINNKKYKFTLTPGNPSVESGAISLAFLNKAIELAKKNKVKGIVTCPISKELIINAGYSNFIDHTTYLANEYKTDKFTMMFHADGFSMSLVTIHIPICEVAKNINKMNLIIAIDNTIGFVEKLHKDKYNIAVCGLNPHAGENGCIGKEDMNIIKPVIRYYHEKGIHIDGPLPADTVFYKVDKNIYNTVITMYHDQGLTYFKSKYFESGVNTTLGLPIVRTSPGHGTAFEIVGKNIANHLSMKNSIELAFDLL